MRYSKQVNRRLKRALRLDEHPLRQQCMLIHDVLAGSERFSVVYPNT
jgi:hypothetical protein